MIAESELRLRIASGENELTEFKVGRPKRDPIARLAVAFANSPDEGWLIWGVKYADGGNGIIGVTDAENVTRRLRNICRKWCVPSIEPDIEVVTINDKRVVVMRVRGDVYKRPYRTAKGEYAIRQGIAIRERTRVVSEDEVTRHIVSPQSLISLFYVESFRSLYGIDLDFKPITLIIGPNASGKSNLLKALRFLHDVMVGDASLWESYSRRADELLWFGRDEEGKIANRMILDFSANLVGEPLADSMHYRLEVRKERERLQIDLEELWIGLRGQQHQVYFKRSGEKVSVARGLHPSDTLEESSYRSPNRLYVREYLATSDNRTAESLTRFVRGWRFVDIDVEKARQGSTGVVGEPVSVPPMGGDGGNLAEVLYALSKLERERYDEIIDRLGRSIGFPKDIRVQLLPGLGEPGEARFAFTETAFPDREISPNSMSDGTIRLLALLTALIGDPEATVICIEEPNHGLHPHLMLRLADTIRAVAAAPIDAGAPASPQVIATTHSPDFMDCFDVVQESSYLQVYIAERKVEDGITQFLSTDEREFAPWLEQYRLGDAVRRNVFGSPG